MHQFETTIQNAAVTLKGAWSVVAPALGLPEFRFLAKLGAVLLPMLLLADVLSGLLKHFGFLSAEWAVYLRVSEQQSIAEFAGFVALQMAAIFCFGVAWKLHALLHFALSAVLEYLLLDDIYGLHEAAGANIAAMLTADRTLSIPGSVGELAYGLAACMIIGLLFMSFFRHSSHIQRSMFVLLLFPFVLLGSCAVGLDFVHSLVPADAKFLGGIIALAEDGGEICAMFMLTLVAAAEWLTLTSAIVETAGQLQQP